MSEHLWSAASLAVALAALVTTTLLLARQARHMEHERNAMAVLEAVERLSDPLFIDVFDRLENVDARYPTDDDYRERYPGSQDERDMALVGAYIETIACLSRRGVIDPSLLVDAVGLGIRRRWVVIRDFVARRRRIHDNPYIAENFEWLAMYSAWWKELPRPRGAKNYDPGQFAGVTLTA